jgi:RNA polymerase sigma factor (TIGR02999 family)
MNDHAEATQLLVRASRGDRRAADEIVPLVYDELRRLAQSLIGPGARGSLQATALVHEAYLRLIDQERVDWQGRTHFLCVAAKQIRRVLIDQVRAEGAQKRGGGSTNVTLGVGPELEQVEPIDLLALDEALEELAFHDARQRQIVELRFFGGLSIEETALALGLSERTVKSDWTFARAWLDHRMSGGTSS